MMETKTSPEIPPQSITKSRKLGPAKMSWQSLAFVCCVLFSLCLTFQVMGAGDGVWFWYSSMFLEGKRLYADLHLVQQPLIVLETAVVMKLFGKGWLVFRIPAVFHVLAFCTALLILAGKSALSDGRKALLFACAFSVSISFNGDRFDDYHIFCDCFVLYAIITFLSLQTATRTRSRVALLAATGVLCGLALTTRLNDGAALLVGVFLAILFSVPNRKVISLLTIALATIATVLLVVLLTGDSLHDYLRYAVFKAASSKGGVSHVLTDPLRVPGLALGWLIFRANLPVFAEAVGASLAWAFLLRPKAERSNWYRIVLGLAIVLTVLFLPQTVPLFVGTSLLTGLAAVVAIFIFPAGLWILARSLRRSLGFGQEPSFSDREIILLIPIGQFASGSMSTGGFFISIWEPLAVILVLLPLCAHIRVQKQWIRDFAFALVALLMLTTTTRRIIDPYSWHSYQEHPLFTGRTLFQHPVYGPMIIDRDLLQFIQPVCKDVTQDDSRPELLSLPFPFSNYFCAIPPWDGYVQTFYDTSSRQTIEELISQLKAAPPKWIFYQKQVHSLRWHEILYNNGEPLAQRDLGQFIEQKIARNQWHVVYTSDYGNHPDWDTHWMLIRTQ